MTWLFLVLILLAIGCAAVIAFGPGAPLTRAFDDRRDVTVPEDRIGGADLRRLRFTTAFRGYRASEVDALLERLAEQLEHQPDPWPGTADRKADPGSDGES